MANIAVRALRLAARTQQPLLYVTQVKTDKMVEWIRTMIGLGLGEWVGPTWVGGTMATVFKKKVKEQT